MKSYEVPTSTAPLFVEPAVAQLATLLMNGRHISPGASFPVGWSAHGRRIQQTATAGLLERAARLADEWRSRNGR